MSKIKVKTIELPDLRLQNERKMSFKRVFVLFVEKFGCIDSLVHNLAPNSMTQNNY